MRISYRRAWCWNKLLSSYLNLERQNDTQWTWWKWMILFKYVFILISHKNFKFQISILLVNIHQKKYKKLSKVFVFQIRVVDNNSWFTEFWNNIKMRFKNKRRIRWRKEILSNRAGSQATSSGSLSFSRKK